VPRKNPCYLFRYPDSANWYIRLQFPGHRFEKSLGTADDREAAILAMPYIAEHKTKLLAARPRVETAWQCELEPGLHDTDDGKVMATERELLHLDAAGKIVRRTPNGRMTTRVVNLERKLGVPYIDDTMIEPTQRPTLAAKTSDDALIETYLKAKNVTGFFEREARDTWATFKRLTDNRTLADATRDDGRKLADHFISQGNKSATTRKKVGWLAAAVNLAVSDGKLKFNPFVGVVPELDDAEKRLPLDAADIKAIKANLGSLSESDQLLVRVLACTGMRLSEGFEIESEAKERGIRYTIIGTKTDQSERRVPFPAGLLPHLPPKITGPLFPGRAKPASQRLNRFVRACGIADKRKVIHSLRHRAQDRLRAAGCPEDQRWAIMGHEEKTVAAGYGEGFPVPMLKRWIDKIGF
jgi:integrase